MEERYHPAEWNIYPFHFSDGDNFSDDNDRAMGLLKEKILDNVNAFSYGQVQGLYGGGSFLQMLKERFQEEEKVLVAEMKSKEDVLDAIKAFLGKGF
jgi:uncharacterized sporulation protein YeaH/YhbH (DUF444 family)